MLEPFILTAEAMLPRSYGHFYAQDVVVHSLLAVQHVVTADRHCFELFGCDREFGV